MIYDETGLMVVKFVVYVSCIFQQVAKHIAIVLLLW